jgi:hypothetical protein
MKKRWENNPVYLFMKTHGYTANEFTIITNTDTNTVYSVLNGVAKGLPRNIIETINSLQEDGDKIAKEYEIYRTKLAESLRTRSINGK